MSAADYRQASPDELHNERLRSDLARLRTVAGQLVQAVEAHDTAPGPSSQKRMRKAAANLKALLNR